MKATIGTASRDDARNWPGARCWAAAVALLSWTSVLAAPPEDAIGLCSAGEVYSSATSGQLTKDTHLLIQGGFRYADWTGYLRAYETKEGVLTAKWPAAAIPPADDRTILTWSGTKGVLFKVDDKVDDVRKVEGVKWPSTFDSAEDQAKLVVNYLRGTDGAFRKRSTPLGAIVNSALAYAGAENFGYEALGGEAGAKYKEFMKTKSARLENGTNQLVLVGANDGMLHGFDAASGVEKFAYVPRALLLDAIDPNRNPPPDGPPIDPRSTLVRLKEPDFKPRYYVDGSPWVGDAYWGGEWKTVAVSAAGAGGRSVFALNIKDPGEVSVLWEIDGQSHSSLGYASGQPVVGRLNDGNFYAIFGNGREGQDQCAHLFLVRLDNGQVKTIPTGACGGNGLGRPSLFDNHSAGQTGYRVTDYVYAGDLKGNVWKFDLTSAKAAEWAVAFTDNKKVPQPLFTAKNADGQLQPITGTIEIGAAPPKVEQVGAAKPAMLWFGTGRYFSAQDVADKSVQSMYGLLDRGTGVINSPSDNGAKSRETLVAQTVTSKAGGAGSVSTNTIDYTATGDKEKRGWYIDLVRVGEEAKGERMTGLPLFQGSQLVFATITPEIDPCAGASSIFAVDPYLGAALPSGKKFFLRAAVADYDFIPSAVGMIRSLVYVAGSAGAHLHAAGAKAGAGTPGVQTEKVLRSAMDLSRGRVSWREILK